MKNLQTRITSLIVWSLMAGLSLTGPLSLQPSDAQAPGGADLALTKRANRHTVKIGQNVTYLIALTNQGPAAATNVVFGDSLPDQLNRVSFSCSKGTVVNQSFCQVDRVAPGERVVARLVATPITNIARNERRVNNTAFIYESGTTDPNPKNNTAAVTIRVVGPPPPTRPVPAPSEAPSE